MCICLSPTRLGVPPVAYTDLTLKYLSNEYRIRITRWYFYIPNPIKKKTVLIFKVAIVAAILKTIFI